MKKKKTNKVIDENKKLVVALTEKIKQHRKIEIGDGFEKDGELFKTTYKFNAKSMTKNQYTKLFALYDFIKENPSLNEDDVRKVLNSNCMSFAFLLECDRTIDNFLYELKKHGPVSMAHEIERQQKSIEKWAKRHL